MRVCRLLAALAVLASASSARGQGVPFNKAAKVQLSVPANPIASGHLRVQLTVDLSGVTGQGPGGSTAAALGAYVVPVRFDKSVLSFAQLTAGTATGYSVTARATPKSAASAVGEVVVAASAEGGALSTGSLLVAELTFYIRRAGLSTSLEVVEHGTIAPLSLASAYVPGPPAKGPAALAGDVTGSGVQVQIPVGSVLSARPSLPQGLVVLLVMGSCLLMLVRRRGRRVHLGLGLMLAWGIAVLGFGELARAAAPLIGDIDDDGTTGAADIVDLQDYLVGNAQAVAGKPTGRGDVDGNGLIDALDLALLRAGIEQGLSIRPAVELLANPSPAKVGEAVTLSWTSTRATSAQISGVGGSRPAAGSVQVTPGSLPAAYTITVTGTGGTGQATASIGKLSTFAMTAVPASVEIPRDSFAFYVVKLSSADGFTGMAELTAEGLPAGVTASFEPAHVAPGSAADLKLKVSASAAVANTSFTVRAKGSSAGVTLEKTASVQVKVLGAGTYSSGRVLTSDAVPVPVPGAALSLVDQPLVTATTDAAGNYLLKNVPAGDHVLKIDCRPASGALGSTLTFVHKAISATANAPNPMPMSFFMPRIDTDEGIDIPGGIVTEDTLFTSAAVPGLEVLLREGTVLTDPEGAPVTRLSITRLEVDRFPGQLMGIDADSIYTLQPEDTRLSIPVEVTYPNLAHTPAKTQTDLYVLDLDQGMFVKFGTGTVSADGTQVVPDPDPARPGYRYGMDHLSWHWSEALFNALAGGGPAQSPGGPQGSDPVDLGTGAYVETESDLQVSSGLGIASLERTYRTLSTQSGPWGTGTSANFDIVLVPDRLDLTTAQAISLLLPGNTALTFSSAGGGVFRNGSDPIFIGDSLTGDLVAGPLEVHFQSGDVWGFHGFSGPPRSQGRLLYTRDRNGNTTTIAHDSSGFPIRITEPGGRFIRLSWNGGRLQSASDSLGRSVSYTYDGNGRLSSFTDAEQKAWTYTWDIQGRRQKVLDPLGNLVAETFYDADGRVASQKQADGGTFTFTYTKSAPSLSTSRVIGTRVTDPAVQSTSYRFGATGYLLEEVDAAGGRTVYQRHPTTNQLVAVTDPLGRTTRFEYHPTRGLLTATVNAAGGRTTYEHDASHARVTRTTDPVGNVSSIQYDARGNPTGVTDARGQPWSYSYDSRGMLESIQDPLGQVTTFTASVRGDISKITDPLGNSVQFRHDAAGRLIQRVDSLDQITRFEYDKMDRVLTRTRPGGLQEKFTYDETGHPLSSEDALGRKWFAAYDAKGRLTASTDPLQQQGSYTYDVNDRLIGYTDRRQFNTALSYDSRGLLTNATYGDGSSVTYGYDGAGRLLRAQDSESGSVELGYDLLNNIVAESTPEGSVRRTYDAGGRRTSLTVDGGMPVTYQYASAGLASMVHGASTFDFTYDALGRLASVSRPNGVISTMAYDEASRVTQVEHKEGATSVAKLLYAFNPRYRRTTVDSPLGSLAPAAFDATHGAANQQISVGGQGLQHDAEGNLVFDGLLRYGYDARNRLRRVDGPGVAMRFEYDAIGRRAARTINGGTTSYLYDQANVAAEIAQDAWRSSVLSGPAVDFWLQRDAPEGLRYYLHDSLGSVVGLTDPAGDLRTSYRYDPFGRTQPQGEASTNAFQFTGRENDGSGLYSYRARYYRPDLQRFLSMDPVGLAGGDLNLYSYTLNDPVNAVDPSGQECQVNLRYLNALEGYATGGLPGYLSARAFNDVLGYAGYGSLSASNAVQSGHGTVASGMSVTLDRNGNVYFGNFAGLASSPGGSVGAALGFLVHPDTLSRKRERMAEKLKNFLTGSTATAQGSYTVAVPRVPFFLGPSLGGGVNRSGRAIELGVAASARPGGSLSAGTSTAGNTPNFNLPVCW